MAAVAGDPADRARSALPVRTEPPTRALAMAQRRHAGSSSALDRGLVAVVLVSVELRKLQRHLWLAWRGDRPDDVDVDVGDHCAVRRGAELGNRAPDRDRQHHRPFPTDGRPRRRDGRHTRVSGSGRSERTLALRINIDAKLAPAWGSRNRGVRTRFLLSPRKIRRQETMDLRASRAP